MSDDPNAVVELCVEIVREPPQALGVMHSPSGFTLVGERTPLIWLPRAEIVKLTAGTDGLVVITIPRWLAEKEGLADAAPIHDPNQGELL